MKITIEGTEEECERASVALARGWAEPWSPPEPPIPMPQGYYDDPRRAPLPDVRECCKTDACRLPPSHPDFRCDP